MSRLSEGGSCWRQHSQLTTHNSQSHPSWFPTNSQQTVVIFRIVLKIHVATVPPQDRSIGMRTILILFLSIMLFKPAAFSQGSVNDYNGLISQADSLYKEGLFREAAYKYTQAFELNGWRGFIPDLYNAARSWARIQNLDSAFRKLDRVITYARHEEFNNYKQFRQEPAFKSLHGDRRWQDLIHKADKKYNNPLIARLDTIFQADQKYRLMMDTVIARSGADSEEAKMLWKKMRESDSINVQKVIKILDKYGWVGRDVVGQRGNITLFLVIQHADLATQLKYLPSMRKAVEEGNADPSHLALLEDRVALRQGKKQIYGSQVAMDNRTGKYYVENLDDPKNVDKRRAAVGLPPLGEYLKQWGIEWNAEQYEREMKDRNPK